MKKRTLVTFFDSNYIPKALATYMSLSRVHNNFKLYALCFDDLSFNVIKKMNYHHFIPIHYSEFENEELQKNKKNKEKMYEYYWSCKPYAILWIMKKTKAEMVTYIDCDFLFFQSPEPIFKEAEKASVLIQPNNFSYDEEKQFLPVGYYCSCWESFKNNHEGHKVLRWWHKKCMEWCYAKFENEKFADQKYLDRWRLLFKGVREVINVGANISPWNIQKFDLTVRNNQILINNSCPLIYYHYHSFKINLINYKYMITGDRENYYRIPKDIKKIIYLPYIKLLKSAIIRSKTIPEYLEYAQKFPESNIKLARDNSKTTFNSYKNITQA